MSLFFNLPSMLAMLSISSSYVNKLNLTLKNDPLAMFVCSIVTIPFSKTKSNDQIIGGKKSPINKKLAIISEIKNTIEMLLNEEMPTYIL